MPLMLPIPRKVSSGKVPFSMQDATSSRISSENIWHEGRGAAAETDPTDRGLSRAGDGFFDPPELFQGRTPGPSRGFLMLSRPGKDGRAFFSFPFFRSFFWTLHLFLPFLSENTVGA